MEWTKICFCPHRMKALLEHTEIYNDLISKTRQNDVSGIQIITNSLNNRRLMRKLTFPASRIDWWVNPVGLASLRNKFLFLFIPDNATGLISLTDVKDANYSCTPAITKYVSNLTQVISLWNSCSGSNLFAYKQTKQIFVVKKCKKLFVQQQSWAEGPKFRINHKIVVSKIEVDTKTEMSYVSLKILL